jgi:2-desacetyl-2-hydroxyethyl bacteriochlorophyllide A dehydrogenase
MRAIINTGPGHLEMRELPLPDPGPGQVRIRTAACAICATDLAMIAGWQRTPFGAIPGHEWSGVVDAAGEGVDPSLVSSRCVAENVLADGGEVGFEHPGGYAEFFLTEAANVRVLPDDFPFTTATLIEPLAVSLRGLRRLRDDAGEPVLIFGDGPIGLLCLALLVRRGRERIVMVGGREARLKLAVTFGASKTLNYHALDEDLSAACGGDFPTIIEASGSASAISAALKLAALNGRVLVLGDYGEDHADFPWNRLLHREIELIGSNTGAGAWDEAVRLAVEGSLPLEHLMTHRLDAERFEEAVALILNRRADVVKAVLRWSH